MKKIVLILFICLAIIIDLIFYVRLYPTNRFRIIFFNVGQGDAALIQFGDGEKMLVDCGPDRKILSKLGEYLPFYDRTIDYLLVSHPDSDHYGGCMDVLRRYQVKNIIGNGVSKEYDPFWRVWEAKLSAQGGSASGGKTQMSNVKTITKHEIWAINDATLEFLAPDESLGVDIKNKEGNNLSVVFKLTRASTTALFVGDAEIPLEQAMIEKYCSSSPSFQEGVGGVAGDGTSTSATPLRSPLERGKCERLHADILKVGHHGSDSSSGEEFLEAVKPERAVVSVGKNKFGHPSLRVLRRLERVGAEIWRTDESGDFITP